MSILQEARLGSDLSHIACLESWTGSCRLRVLIEAGVKTEKLGEWQEEIVSAEMMWQGGYIVRERRSLDILPEKKKQSCLQVKCQERWWEAVKRICGVGVY